MKKMTKEEAIHILECERDNYIFCSSYRPRVHMALTMAVEALKREDTMLKEIERVVLYGERSEDE